jgi:hypothetical protein
MTTTPLPEMSQQEASWHTHLAAMRAQETARNQGANPHAVAAFATATAGPVTIAGYTLHPASQGTVWTLKRVATDFTAWADRLGIPTATTPESPGTREMLELGLTTLVFCDSRQCWIDLETGKLEQLISRADAMIWNVELTDLLALQTHFQTQMARIGALSGEEEAPGKPQPQPAASGPSPVMPIPPRATESPLVNGWQRNTPPPSPPLSGALHS